MRKVFSVALSLRGRLVMLACLATLPAVLFAFYIANNERSAALQRMEEDARHIVSLISREHYYQLAGAKSLLMWLSENLSQQRYDTQNITSSNLLPAVLAGYPQLANIAILTPKGDVVSSAYPLPAPVNMRDYEAIRRALNSREIETGAYVIGPIVQRPILHLAYAVRDRAGSARWIVFVAVDLEWLGRMTSQADLPAEHILLIVDREGRVLASSAKPVGAAIPVGTLVPELAEDHRQGRTMMNIRIGTIVQPLAIAQMENIPGVLIASGVPYEKVLRKANAVFFRMIALLLLLTLCTVFFVMIFEEVALIRYLRVLSRTLRRFGQGDFSVRAAIPYGEGEFQEMATTFNAMAETIALRHRELRKAHDQLNVLARHLQLARESEAQRIARDLHDEAGQVLTSLKIDLAGLQKNCRLCQARGATGKTVESDIMVMSKKIDGMIGFIRRISSDLRPPVLDKMGLAVAIEMLARDVEKNSDLAIDTKISGIDQLPLDWLVSTALYRIVQEALTNVLRHAQAKLVGIDLHRTTDRIALIVKDDGKGIDRDTGKREALGIIGMRERAHLVGGTFSIESPAGGGTTISVEIPVVAERRDVHEILAG
jgi:signal transduction histidine kinase